jgi:hypothetical protein
MEYHPDEVIDEYKRETISTLREGIVPNAEPGPAAEAAELIDSIDVLSKPLFVQAMIMQSLIPRTFRHGLLYYSRIAPSELESFYWTIDAKETKKVVDYERAWSMATYVFMYSQSVSEPLRLLEGGDYSYFERFCGSIDDPEIVASYGYNPDDLEAINWDKVFGENLKFTDSKEDFGLQLVDILTTATRRALNGTLSKDGWSKIGRLILAENKEGQQWALEPFALKYWDGIGNRTFVAENSAHVYETYLSQAKRLFRRPRTQLPKSKPNRER